MIIGNQSFQNESYVQIDTEIDIDIEIDVETDR